MNMVATWLIAGGCLLLIIGSWWVPAPEQKVVFLDVGQGDAILLQDTTQQVLIDGGPDMTVVNRLAEELPWFDRTVEVMILTHPQQDHLQGLLAVLERYEVELVVLPEWPYPSQLQAAWLQLLADREIPYRYAWGGQELQVGDMRFQVLNPVPGEGAKAAYRADANNVSTTVRVDFAGGGEGSSLSFLLTGDVEKRVEELLLATWPAAVFDVDVLKAGHHGSDSSTHEPLLRAATPRSAVISVGADNRFGHPRAEVLERLQGMPVWRTDEVGSVRFVRMQTGWHVQCGGAALFTGGEKSCIKTGNL